MKRKSTGELIAEIVVNIVGFAFVNSLPFWQRWTMGVVLDSWTEILWAANLSIAVQIAGNLLLIVYRPARLHALTQALFAAVNVVSITVFWQVFPLDFSQFVVAWLNRVLRLGLILAAVGTAIGGIVHLVRMVLGTPYVSKGSSEEEEA